MRDRESCYKAGKYKMYGEREKKKGKIYFAAKRMKEKRQNTSSFI
jgi:hypothetical protein